MIRHGVTGKSIGQVQLRITLSKVIPLVIEDMEEQTGSPGANTDSNNQRNGDEVRAHTQSYYVAAVGSREEEEEANEGQHAPMAPNRLCSLSMNDRRSSYTQSLGRVLSRDYEGCWQRVEQAAPEEKVSQQASSGQGLH
ncbi:high mobility group protein 20A isoform X1 [Lates japonicus]|uniref:High mobility group protein 20A isoform X1 n=1 Tax=Lates japonicus TaxID=270547 RepID=A0AAD3R8M9_LATJO|nr:high mobility group protein 20A isoform X1 [Lates japonicus]